MDEDNIKKADSLQKEAKEVLDNLDLLSILNKVGEPNIVGSLELNLMSHRDIDIVVRCNPDYEKFLKIVNELFRKEEVYDMAIQDFRKSIHSNRPQGIYCKINYLRKPDLFWKIDIWFIKHSTAEDVVDWVKPKLTDVNKKLILKIKNEMREKIKNGKQISGYKVYKAVLEYDVKDLEEFKKYLHNLGREI